MGLVVGFYHSHPRGYEMNPRVSVNDSRLTTARLSLAAFSADDTSELLDLFRDRSVRRYLLDDMEVDSDWVRSEIEASSHRFRHSGAGLWTLRKINESRIIGFAGFREFFDPPELQLLYGLLPTAWGQGLATEAAHAVVAFGFERLGMRTIRAATDLPNGASIRVLRRLGMKRVEETRDGWAGTVFFELSRSTWLAQVRGSTKLGGAVVDGPIRGD